ncbi:ABC transporter ATP-binding protein [Thioalkalivibrio sp. XN279]|uniref:ABC transporter ATP-binding protein n=1 Tax=Thioalkalivibrio sp. XN279 TaxID=2714953 RepID=UPI001408735B|nr:ABC transporter ATP-binding protein [Thioalkalivibrio sp. XN279]NHA14221.1 ABC transporter ATP-binding protein [Thioalkalivibrio sp. XN279]
MWLTVEGIEQAYGDNRVLKDLSFRIPAGAIGCLLGPSGCGKTTALRCIAGFENVQAGRILLNGEVLSRPGFTVPPEKRGLGMVFQQYALFPHLDVAANVGFGLRGLKGAEKQRRVAEVLDVVGLGGRENLFPDELSGGQQQRVALARALAPRPGLLLMDEPFSSLDTGLRVRLGTEIRDILKQQGITALLVTHDQAEAFAVADEIGVMREGRLEQWDTAYNLYHRPASRFVAEFVGEGCFVPGEAIGDGTVQIELGRLEPTEPMALAAAESVEVLLRPDDIVHDDDSSQTATVLRKAFRGASILYTLGLPSGRRVLALVPSHHDHRIGERIGIRLEADHVVVFQG